MSVILPYEMPPLATGAPLDIHRSTVLPEWVDWNGHMNVAYYVLAFDQASGTFMRNMGLGRHYVEGKHGMTFVLETHVTYDREMRGGAPTTPGAALLSPSWQPPDALPGLVKAFPAWFVAAACGLVIILLFVLLSTLLGSAAENVVNIVK